MPGLQADLSAANSTSLLTMMWTAALEDATLTNGPVSVATQILLPVVKSSTQLQPQGFFSDAALANFMAVFSWFFPFLCALAIVFCLLNAAVYWQQKAAAFAWFLIGVDFGDGVCALMGLLSSLTEFSLTPNGFAPVWIKRYLATYVAGSARRAAIVLNALASFERVLAIAFPLKKVSQRMCSKPWLVVVGVIVVSLLGHLHIVLEYDVVESPAESLMYKLTPTELKTSRPELLANWALVSSLVFGYGPLVAILIINTALLVVLKVHVASLKNVRRERGNQNNAKERSKTQSYDEDSGLATTDHIATTKALKEAEACDKEEEKRKKKQEAVRGHKSKENQTTRMVLAFSTVFLLMALPSLLSFSAQNVWESYSPVGREKNLNKAVGLFSTLTSHFTETALFWVSLTYSRHFRRALLRLPLVRNLFGRCLSLDSRACSPREAGVTSSSVDFSSSGAVTEGSSVFTQGP